MLLRTSTSYDASIFFRIEGCFIVNIVHTAITESTHVDIWYIEMLHYDYTGFALALLAIDY